MKSQKRKGEFIFLALLLFILTLLVTQFVMAVRQSSSPGAETVQTVEAKKGSPEAK